MNILGGISVRLSKKNILEIVIVIFAVFGIIYSFYNVLSERVLKSENRQEIHRLSELILSSQESADRLECRSQIYVKKGEELVEDKLESTKFIYDYDNNRLQTIQKDTNEIIQSNEGEIQVYSKGISPVYIKQDKRVKKVSSQSWYHYDCERIYGNEKRAALTDKVSYGYLKLMDDIIRIRKTDDTELNGMKVSKYIVTIKNSIRDDLTEDMGDTGLRKILSKKGLNPTFLKNGYPTVYHLLKDIYNRETEEICVWLNEENVMVRLEKDCTFSYYIEVMKGNSDLIKSKLGRYDYPEVICIQEYDYNLKAEMVTVPQKFIEL